MILIIYSDLLEAPVSYAHSKEMLVLLHKEENDPNCEGWGRASCASLGIIKVFLSDFSLLFQLSCLCGDCATLTREGQRPHRWEEEITKIQVFWWLLAGIMRVMGSVLWCWSRDLTVLGGRDRNWGIPEWASNNEIIVGSVKKERGSLFQSTKPDSVFRS